MEDDAAEADAVAERLQKIGDGAKLELSAEQSGSAARKASAIAEPTEEESQL